MIFLPAVDLLVVGGMIGACIIIVIIALLITPPTHFVNKLMSKDEDKSK